MFYVFAYYHKCLLRENKKRMLECSQVCVCVCVCMCIGFARILSREAQLKHTIIYFDLQGIVQQLTDDSFWCT